MKKKQLLMQILINYKKKKKRMKKKKKKKKKKKVDIMQRDLFLRYKMGTIIWSPLESNIMIDYVRIIEIYFAYLNNYFN